MPGIYVEHVLQGIEELNQRALAGELEMTAVSLHAYAYCADRYVLLTTGASVGEGVGPVVVAREAMEPRDLGGCVVAVPGHLTTASLLLQLAVGRVEMKVMPFDRILEEVVQGRVRAGILIHEGQLTYPQHGLKKVLDLGQWWKDRTGLPAPLGVNVLRRDLGTDRIRQVALIFKQSLDYALAHRAEALRYAMRYGRGLDEGSTDRFVAMYVNRWALDCRPDGARAMGLLLDEATEAKLIPRRVMLEFALS